MMKKQLLIIVLILVMVVTLVGCGSNAKTTEKNTAAQIEHPKSLVICASTMGGPWHTAGTKISELLMKEFPDMSVAVIEGGSDTNIQLVNDGRDAQMGFTSSISVLPALEGKNPAVKDASKVDVILPINSAYIQTAVFADSNIKEFPDLVGKNISPGKEGFASKLGFEAIMEAYGYSIDNLKKAGSTYQLTAWSEYPDLMSDKHIDACALNGPLPASIFMQIEATKPLRLLSIGKEQQASVIKKYPSLFVKTIQPGAYKGTTQPVDLLGYTALIIANDQLPDAFLVRLVELLQENKTTIQTELGTVFDLLGWENATTGMIKDATRPAIWNLIQSHNK